MFRVDLPDSRYMDNELVKLDKRIKTKVLKSAMRSAAGVFRTALRKAARAHKDSGDLAKSAAVAVRRSRNGGYYAVVGFRYGKFGDRPKTPQDPGVYARFLEGGATRQNRGSVRATNFASNATDKPAVANQATQAFANKFKAQLDKLAET